MVTLAADINNYFLECKFEIVPVSMSSDGPALLEWPWPWLHALVQGKWVRNICELYVMQN